MRVNVEGTKYTICSDDSGKVWIERHGEPWITNPDGAKLWIAVAYELGCLRRIAAKALDSEAFMGEHGQDIKALEGYTDFRRNLDDPGIL